MQMTSESSSVQWIGGAALILFGTLSSLFGFLFLEPFLFLLGLIGGFSVAAIFQTEQTVVSTDVCTHGLAFAALCGLAVGVLMVSLVRCAAWLLVCLSFSLVVRQVMLLFPTDEATFLGLPFVPHWIIVVASTLLVSLVARKTERWTRLILTAVLGSLCFIIGVRVCAKDTGLEEWHFDALLLLHLFVGAATQRYLSKESKKEHRPASK